MTVKRLTVTAHPHIHSGATVSGIMVKMIFALLPLVLVGIYNYGMNAAVLALVTVLGAVGTDAVFKKGEFRRLKDFHAIYVGLLLCALLPPGMPLWMGFVAGLFAILLGKAPFGPLGGAFMPAAIVGFLVVYVSWGASMVVWQNPFAQTPLGVYVESPLQAVLIDSSDEFDFNVWHMFLGFKNVSALGTASGAVCIAGGIALFILGVFRVYATIGYLIGVISVAFILQFFFPNAPLVGFHLVSGYTLISAVFLVNDIPSSPQTPIGKVLFGLLAGCLTVLLRHGGVMFASSIFAIAMGSLIVPLVDKLHGKWAILNRR